MTHSTMIVAKSGNTKTGPIPVTYRTMDTCPSDCPFLPTGPVGGCYGTGRIFGIAGKGQKDMTITDMVAKLESSPEDAKYLRDRVVGDVVGPDGTIDHEYIRAITIAARAHGLTPFGYTHAWRRMTADDVDQISSGGYVMNASCETVEDVEQATFLGMPAVVTNDDLEEGSEIAGRRVVTCPAQTRDDVSCASCGLCAKPQRKAVVRFQIHGTAKNKARRAVAERKAS